MDDKSKEKANAEYEKLRSLYVHKEIQREAELRNQNIGCGLDGINHFKDIDEWYYSKLEELKKKYNIQ